MNCILALPMYPVHAENECQANKLIKKTKKQQKTNPFSALRSQMGTGK